MVIAAPRIARRRMSLVFAVVGAASVIVAAIVGSAAIAQEPQHSAELDAAIIRAAKRHGVPEHLVRRIVMRESRYNPRARNHSFWGLMQISYPTARSMGFKGTPEQLLNPVTNLAYAVPYLANAFVSAGRQEDAAVRLYASGYYATAKNRGVLGLLRTAESKPLNGVPDEPITGPAAVVASDAGGWSLFGASAPAPEAAAPVPQQLAYAAIPEAAATPAQAQIQAIARAAPQAKVAAKTSDKNAGDGVAMVAGRDGAMAPPRRWQHDGGLSVVSRGEQGPERVAASRQGGAPSSDHHSRKTTVYAQLDEPGAAAATTTDAQPTSFLAAALAPAADPAQISGRPTAVETATDADGDKPKHRRRRHKSAAE